MAAVWITSIANTNQHGVFAIDVPPPAQIQPTGTGYAAMAAQFPWGPDDETPYEVTSMGEAKQLFAPAGSDRLSTGYLALLGKAFANLALARVMGTNATKSSATLDDGTDDIVTVEAKYKGPMGDDISLEVKDATDGDADHWNLVATLTGDSGNTVETFHNLNCSGTGADALGSTQADIAQRVLIGAITKLVAGRPDNGTYTMSGGSTGTNVAAAKNIPNGSSVNVLSATAKTAGSGGNSITITIATASDADANHFNVTITDGVTPQTLTNQNISGTGSDVIGTATLVTFAKLVNGRPANGTYTLTGGVSGAISAARYTAAIAKFEGNKRIRQVFADDCGSSFRPTVNAALVAHAEAMGDRIAFINGDSGVSAAATVRTDAANYSSTRCIYADPWVYIYDDTTGSEQLVPGSSFQASVRSQLSPSTSIAWKSEEVQAMLRGIVRLEYSRGLAAGTNSEAGVATFIREESGGHTIEAGVLTIAPANPAKRNDTRTAMGDYMAISLAKSLRPYVDAPNVRATWDLIIPPIHAFLTGLKKAADTDPAHLPHIVDFALGRVNDANTRAEIARGELKLPLQVQTSAGIEKLVFLFQFGPTVSVTAQ